MHCAVLPYLLSVAVLLEHTLLQLLRGVEAHLLLTVIHRCNLDDNGEVTAGALPEWSGSEPRYRGWRSSGCPCRDGRTACRPPHGLEVDDKLNLFGHLDRADTEDTANVNDADATQLDKVADNLGRRTDERLVGYTLDLNRVVRDQTVAALYQLDRGLGLADTGVTEQKHAFAVDFDEYAVQRNTRCKFYLEEGDRSHS